MEEREMANFLDRDIHRRNAQVLALGTLQIIQQTLGCRYGPEGSSVRLMASVFARTWANGSAANARPLGRCS